jgi:hypothetical protein
MARIVLRGLDGVIRTKWMAVQTKEMFALRSMLRVVPKEKETGSIPSGATTRLIIM